MFWHLRVRQAIRGEELDESQHEGPSKQEYALHRYFIWANRMRQHYDDSMKGQGPPPEAGYSQRMWLSGPYCYASLWFALLYVVAEGWKELGLDDDEVTKSIQSAQFQTLRRFRNGVFHYQKEYFDKKATDFFSKDMLRWATGLHDALSKAFILKFISRAEYEGLLEAFEDQPIDDDAHSEFEVAVAPLNQDGAIVVSVGSLRLGIVGAKKADSTSADVSDATTEPPQETAIGTQQDPDVT